MVKRIPNKFISITLSLIIITIIILIPFAFLAFEVTQQGYIFYSSLSNNVAKGALFGYGCVSADSKVCLLLNQAEKFSSERLTTFGFDKQLQKLQPILEEKIASFILSIPVIIAKFFLAVIIAYFIIKDWENILKQIVDMLPMRKKTINRLIIEFRDITYTVVYAQLFVAVIQGIVATVGYYIFGVPFPVIFGILTAFCTLIPTAGTAIIWLPASLFLILSGYYSGNYGILYNGIGLLLYSFFILNIIDNLLLIRLVHTHTKVKVSQISIIIGVIGGVLMFGVIGIFIGPILLPLLITYFQTFKERFT